MTDYQAAWKIAQETNQTLLHHITELETNNAELVSTLEELTDLMEDTVSRSYKPDSYTAQPARALLNRIKPRQQPPADTSP